MYQTFMKQISLHNRVTIQVLLVGLLWVLGLSSNAQSLLGLSDLSSFEKLLDGKTHFSIDSDGDYVAIGDYHSSTTRLSKTIPQVGCVLIYKRSKTEGWTFFQEIKSPGGRAFDNFGVSVALSEKFLVIGAIGVDQVDENGQVIEDTGAAYFYTKDSKGEFVLAQKICSNDLKPYAIFGSKVDIKEDEITINSQTEENNNTNWVAYTFKQVDGNIWSPVKKAASDDHIKHPTLSSLFPEQ
jgi:hypothetical protein